jgi:phosphatidylinositol glycan class A protein
VGRVGELQVSNMYSWPRIAARTEVVYYAAAASERDDSLAARFGRYARCGIIFGKLCCCVAAADYLLWKLIEWWYPAGDIDIATDFPSSRQQADGA